MPAVSDDIANPHFSDLGSFENEGISHPVRNEGIAADVKVNPGVVANATNMVQPQQDLSKFVIYDQFGQQSLITMPSEATFMVQNAVQGNVLLAPVVGMQLNPITGLQQLQSVLSGFVPPPKGQQNTVTRNPSIANSVVNEEDPASVLNSIQNLSIANSAVNEEQTVKPPVETEDISDNKEDIAKPADVLGPKGDGDGSPLNNHNVPESEGVTNPDTPGSMLNSLLENKEETAKPADVPGPEGDGDGSTATNPPPVPESEGVTNPDTPGSMSNSLSENKEATAKPDVPGHEGDGDGSTATNPPPVPESESVTNPEVHAGTPGSVSNSLSKNKGDTAKNDELVSKSDSTTPPV